MLSLRVSRDKRGYDHIYLLAETRRKGRTAIRVIYGGRWPSPMRIGQPPLDDAIRRRLEEANPNITFDWVALQRTLQQALTVPRGAPVAAAGRGGRRPGADARSAGAGVGAGAGGGPGGSRQGARGGPQQGQRPPVAAKHKPYEPAFARDVESAPIESGEPIEPIEPVEVEAAAEVDDFVAEQIAEQMAEVDADPTTYTSPELEISGELEIDVEMEQTFVVSSDTDAGSEGGEAAAPADDRQSDAPQPDHPSDRSDDPVV